LKKESLRLYLSPVWFCSDLKTVKAQMWEKQDGERDFSEDTREAKKLCVSLFNTLIFRRQEAIENINEVMEEIRAEVY
jgi:hypothetical protein